VGAYGLALQAMGDGKITSSLLPQKIRKEKMWQEKTKWFAAAAALIVLGSGLGFGRVYLGNSKFAAGAPVRQTIDGKYAEDKAKSDGWMAIQNAGGPQIGVISNIKAMTGGRGLWGMNIIPDLHNALPPLSPNDSKIGARSERTQVVMDDWEARYIDDMSSYLKMSAEDFRTA